MVDHSMDENSNNHRIILRGRTQTVAAAVDHFVNLHTFVKFRLPAAPAELVRGRELSYDVIRKIPAMLIDSFSQFCEPAGFEEWNDGTLWFTARDCKPNLTWHVHELCHYMTRFYCDAYVRRHTAKLSETALVAAAEVAGVYILDMTTCGAEIVVDYVGRPDNISFLSFK